MRLHRFYTTEKIESGSEITLRDPSLCHQLGKVFRFQSGDKIILFNGSGFDYVSIIKNLSRETVVLETEKQIRNTNHLSKDVTLAVSLIKKDNFEQVVNAGTQIGVNTFIPIHSQYSEKKNLNFERLNKIATEATEQCGRDTLPIIEKITELEDLLSHSDRLLVLDTQGGESIGSVKDLADPILLIGPEGGWSDTERKLFHDHKLRIIKIDTHILRAEVAAIVTAAKIIA